MSPKNSPGRVICTINDKRSGLSVSPCDQPSLIADALPIWLGIGILGKASVVQDVGEFPDRTSRCSRRPGLDRATCYFHEDPVVLKSVPVLVESGGEFTHRFRHSIPKPAVFRKLHPDCVQYTYWGYFRNALERNFGWRIDHILATAPLADRCQIADVDLAP